MSNDAYISDDEFDAKVRKMLAHSSAAAPDPTLAHIQARRQAEQVDEAYLDRLAELVAARIKRRPTIEPYDARRASQEADERWRAAVNNELDEARKMVGTLADLLGKALDRVTALEKSVAVLSSKAASGKYDETHAPKSRGPRNSRIRCRKLSYHSYLAGSSGSTPKRKEPPTAEEDGDINAMLAYALQEQRQAGNTYTAALLRKIPKLLDEIETLKTRRRRREPLIASDEFPDEAKIIGGQMLERHCGLTAGLTRGGTSSASLGRPCSLA